MFGLRNKSAEKTGLLLSGGGARAAYQVGVLKAISELCPEDENPFHIISGTSAGSINAVALASHEGPFPESVSRIHDVWANFQLNHVFRSEAKHLYSRIFKWVASRILPFNLAGTPPSSLLDNTPLRNLLAKHIDFSAIQRRIDSGKLSALSINASSYTSGESVTFYQCGNGTEPWERAYREGTQQDISLDMLIASSSIPILFSPVKIDNEYYGDGSMRQNTPLSPLVHLGAKKILIIGVRKREGENNKAAIPGNPSMSQISGFVMDTLFLNSLDSDIERLNRINELTDQIAKRKRKFERIEHLIISPTEDLGEMAKELFDTLPRSFRFALKLLGVNKNGSTKLVSYLMFNKEFCRRLIQLGYDDAMKRHQEIMEFLDVEC